MKNISQDYLDAQGVPFYNEQNDKWLWQTPLEWWWVFAGAWMCIAIAMLSEDLGYRAAEIDFPGAESGEYGPN